MNKNRIATFLLLVTGTVASWSVQAGDLEPPGPPGPTMKDLETVEPRVPLRNDFVNIIPIVISQPGSYYLAEDIFAIHSQHGIQIMASNVTLDLNGFTIYGNTEVGSFNGILVDPDLTNIGIKNGTVRDFFWNGISAQATENIQVVDVRSVNNVLRGFWLGSGSTLSRSIASDNGGNGIDVGLGTVTGCTTRNNGGHGIRVSGSVVSNVLSSGNGGDGIWANMGSIVTACRAGFNNGDGIEAEASLIRGSSSFQNLGLAINALGGAVVLENYQ